MVFVVYYFYCNISVKERDLYTQYCTFLQSWIYPSQLYVFFHKDIADPIGEEKNRGKMFFFRLVDGNLYIFNSFLTYKCFTQHPTLILYFFSIFVNLLINYLSFFFSLKHSANYKTEQGYALMQEILERLLQ